MIKITDYKGRISYVAATAVASVTEASAGTQCLGIRCIVKLFDGSVIEAGDTAECIAQMIESEGS